MNPILSFLWQRLRLPKFALLFLASVAAFSTPTFATTKGLSQIVTPDLQDEGDLSLSLQIQDGRIANPYELQAEMGVTKRAEFAIFRGLQPDDWIFGTEFGLIQKEPYLLSAGFVNWSPKMHVDPQPYLEAGYYTEHHKFMLGATHDLMGYVVFTYTFHLWSKGAEEARNQVKTK